MLAISKNYLNPSPNTDIFRGARYGRTVESPLPSALHLTVVGGQTARGQGAGGGQLWAGGHFTSGQRGRGQGGHSPDSLVHADVSMITGCCFGMLLFSTYLLRSGTGGHWVLSMYWLKSCAGGQGGTVALSTYLLMSGCLQGGHTSCETSPPLGHEHCCGALLQFAQTGIMLSKPSLLSDLPPIKRPSPNPTPRTRTSRARITRGVNLNGTTEAISSSIEVR